VEIGFYRKERKRFRKEHKDFFLPQRPQRISQRTQRGIFMMQTEKLFKEVLDCSFRIHSALGPGLLESVYEECLFYEFKKSGLFVEKQKPFCS